MPRIAYALVFLAMACFTLRTTARPVAYKGTTTLMARNKPAWNELMIHQTITRRLSLGAQMTATRDTDMPDRRFWAADTNLLLARLNGDGWQGNAYLSGGYGMEEARAGLGGHADRGVGFYAGEADWESRRYYLSGRWSNYVTRREDPSILILRGGLAPYTIGFDGLHSWLVLEYESRNWGVRDTVTPLLRVFFQNMLFEIGASLDGQWLFNWNVEL